MTKADKAFTVAAEMIAKAQREGATRLTFDTDETRALTDLPPGIADLTGLRRLDLNNTQISDAGLAQIAGLTGLQVLWLNNTQISDAGLAQIAGLTALQALYLSNTQITDAGSAHIAGLTGLRTLSLRNTPISDAGLAQIAGLTELQELWLTNTQISDAGLAKIAGLTALQALYLSNSQISDAGLAEIAGLTGLKALWLHNTQINDLRLLRGFTKLLEPDHWGGLRFEGCAAAKADPQIAEIAAIEDDAARAQALFDLIDAGWVPPNTKTARSTDQDDRTPTASYVPLRRAAPMEIVVSDTEIDLLRDGSLPKSDANARAAMGWQALKDYRNDFANSFNIGNYAPLPAYLAAFDLAMGEAYDANRVIRIGMQGRRFVALSLDDAFLQNLPDGAGADLKNFAAEVLIYLNRFPNWVAYREDADDISPEAVRKQADSFNAVRRAIDASPEASDAVKAEYAAEVALGTAPNATSEEATGIVATTGEFTRALAQADKDRQKRNRDGAKHASDLWNKTVVAPLGMPKMVALRLEAPVRELSAAYPGRLGWIIDWYDVTFGKPEDRD